MRGIAIVAGVWLIFATLLNLVLGSVGYSADPATPIGLLTAILVLPYGVPADIFGPVLGQVGLAFLVLVEFIGGVVLVAWGAD